MFLWAEDGNIFLNQAQMLRLKSIWTPYAGYMILFPRIISIISIYFDLLYRPTVLLIGWGMTYLLMIYSIARTGLLLGLSLGIVTIIICLVVLQPSSNEVFFNITNAQWLLGLSLFLLVIVENNNRKSLTLNSIAITPLVFTGPYSIILSIVIIFSLYINRDWGKRKTTYIIVLSGAIIQASILICSPRMKGAGMCTDIWEWVVAFEQMIFFSANTLFHFVISILYWSLYTWTAVRSIRSKEGVIAFLLLISSVLIIASSLYSSKLSPHLIVPLGHGNRYTWIPFSLIIISGIIFSMKNRSALSLILILSCILCATAFSKIAYNNLQFNSFAKFSEVKEIDIPINPQWPKYPTTWFIQAAPTGRIKNQPPMNVVFQTTTVDFLNLTIQDNEEGLGFNSLGPGSAIELKETVDCKESSDIGLELEMSRNVEGWIKIYISKSKSFIEFNSLRRWYPKGRIQAQFAFRNHPTGNYIRLEPIDTSGSGEINAMRVYCLN